MTTKEKLKNLVGKLGKRATGRLTWVSYKTLERILANDTSVKQTTLELIEYKISEFLK